MTPNKDLPENIRQAIDLISAVIRRIHEKALAISDDPCLYNREPEGVTA